MKRFEGPTITNLKLFYKILQKKNQFGKLSQSTKTTQTDTGKIKGLR